ncbi:hypothetical protein GCM10010207_65970 [Streptomyces atratus]|nr:hypothetical protein [Streptomyces atratus]GGT56849.1 hypothetical protein GCM10010207_65970 [Streptomyces atratus]
MYEPVVDAWKRYSRLLNKPGTPWRASPGVMAEIHTRFGQLDMLMESIVTVLDSASWSPADEGETADDERRLFLQAWDWASVYTDAFYFFGWRTVDLLNGAVDGPLPCLEPIRPTGLLAVRDSLHDHPEGQGDYYRHGLEFREEALEKISRAADALEAGGGGTEPGSR